MALFDYMLRLGTELVGSNMDLAPLPREDDSDGSGDGDGDGEKSDETDGTPEGGEGSEGDDTEDTDEDTEDTDEDTDGEGDGEGDGEDADTDADGEGSDGEGSDGEGGEDTDEDTDGEGSGDGDSEGDDSDGEGEGSGDGDGDGDGDSDGDSGGDSGGDSDGAAGDGSDDFGDPGAEGAGSDALAGGHCDLGDDPKAFLDGLLAALEANDTDLLDNNEAMGSATEGERDDDCLDYEQVWRPFDPSLDEIVRPSGGYNGMAKIYRDDARLLTAGIRSQFRAKFLMAKTKKVIHGTRRGKDLSERRLVESFIEIKSGIRPSRPYFQNVKSDDVSIAVAVVGDQSGSMRGSRARSAATAMVAMAEAFDTLGSPVMCCGPRNGRRAPYTTTEQYNEDDASFHRISGARIDLFKDWDEPFRTCKDRFGSYTASGGTPLSDGIQFAMQELSTREERYRVILVLTDGQPDCPRVVRRQIRLAAEAGIFVIGVGIGEDGYAVTNLFPLHVTVPSLDTLAKRMMETISTIVFPKHAKKAALDGLMASGGFR